MTKTSILFIVIILMITTIIAMILSGSVGNPESYSGSKLCIADAVVMTVNDSAHYYTYVPEVIKGWEKIGIKPYVYYIGTDIPEIIDGLVHQIIPPEGVNIISFAQVSRLLLPATIKAENVMITDVDMLPLPSGYWAKSGGNSRDAFVAMRKKKMKDYMMGWNSASPQVWAKVFDLNNITQNGVIEKMKNWKRSGVWDDQNWNSDQIILKAKLQEFRDTGGEIVDLNEDIFGSSFIDCSTDRLRAGPLNGKKLCYPVNVEDLVKDDKIVTFGPDSDKESSEQYKQVMKILLDKY